MTQGEDLIYFSESELKSGSIFDVKRKLKLIGLRLNNILVTRFTPDSVRVGDYHLDEVDWMSEQDIPVKRIILHENWNEVSIMIMIVMMMIMMMIR